MKATSFSGMLRGMALGALVLAVGEAAAVGVLAGSLFAWNALIDHANYQGDLDGMQISIPPVSSISSVCLLGIVIGAIVGGARLSR